MALFTAGVLLFGLAAILGGPVLAQDQAQQTVAERCFEYHKFGAQPVDVAKTADGQTVLAQTSWGYHDSIGCYLSLDNGALATLRAAPPPQSLPDAKTTTSLRCFARHRFGAQPVDVAKTADGQTVLARLNWGYHDSIGCFLVLDNTALATLRATETTSESDQTEESDELEESQEDVLGVRIAFASDPEASTDQSFEVVVELTHAVSGFSADDITVVNGDVTSFSGSDSEYRATVRAISPGNVVMWVRPNTVQDQSGNSNERSWPLVASVRKTTPMTLSIAAGSYHSCAIKSDQTITCWGYDNSGQADAPDGQYAAITGGLGHSCGVKVDQTIACWGIDDEGQASAPPGQFTAIAVGDFHSCAIRTDQTIACWGYSGLTGTPTGQYTAISAGGSHVCAISTDSTAQCWGDDFVGQANAPAGQYTDIAAGHTHSCAIKIDQTITCWGDNDHGQADAPAGQYTDITAGTLHSCAIKIDQTIACWGDDSLGQADAFAGQYTDISTSSTTGNEFFDTWDREAVLAGFDAEFDRQEPDPGWTGDLARCIAGTTSQQFRASVTQRVNWYRQMAGLNPVAENPEYSAAAQQAALIMAAEGELSHHPNADWACYTQIGANAARSNLHLGSYGTSAINSYMRDSGSNNLAVGHRRWILYPQVREIGTGDILPGRNRAVNALHTFGLPRADTRQVREERGFVAWPSPGYTPYTVVWGRWSFTLSNADFSNATVAVVDDNGPVEVQIINRDPITETGIVWAMDGDTNSRTHIRPLNGDLCYAVTISGVQIGGETQPPYEYATCVTDFYE